MEIRKKSPLVRNKKFREKELLKRFWLNASLLFQESCPEESQFFLMKHFTEFDNIAPESPPALDGLPVCKYCYKWLRPDNHRMRLRPKRHPSARVQRLLRRRAEGKALNLVQKRLLKRFWASSSVLMATCHTCNKTSRHKGIDRQILLPFPIPIREGKHKTPPSTARTTPANTPGRTPAKDKTPHRTPRSATSTPGSASSSSTPSAKTPSKGKNWMARQLSKILTSEDKPVKKKGTLKDFLSLL